MRLQQLTTLEVILDHSTNLAGLEKLPHLTTLEINGPGLTSLAGLENLPQLTTLKMGHAFRADEPGRTGEATAD